MRAQPIPDDLASPKGLAAGEPAPGHADGGVHTIHYMRAVAALAVTLGHFLFATGVPAHWLGKAGVDIFFVVSGFIIPYAMWRNGYSPRSYPRFLAKRLIRLEPAYIASIALAVLVAYSAAMHPLSQGITPSYSALQILSHLFYLVPLTDQAWVNPVYWTLAYEFAFYLSIGLLFPLCVRSEAIFAALGCACFAIMALAFDGTLQAHRVGLFYLGLAAFRHFTGLDAARAFAINLALGTLMVLSNPLTLGKTALDLEGAASIAGPLAAIWLVVPLRRTSRLVFLFSHISYSLYLLHVPIGNRFVHVAGRLLPGPLGEVIAVGGALVLCIVAAYIWYRMIELPSIRLSKRVSYVARSARGGLGLVPLHPAFRA